MEAAAITTIKTSDKTSIKYTSEGITEYTEPGIGAILGGAWVGGMANTMTSKGVNSKILGCIAKKMKSISLSPEEEISLFKGRNIALEQSGMKAKGVSILKGGSTGITDWFPKKKDGFWKKIMNLFMGCSDNMVAEGKNAFFAPSVNKVVLPPFGKGPVQLSAFHEIGHSINFNASKIGRILQKARGLTLLAIPISLIAIYKTQKAPDEKAEGIVDKSTDFIKNNAGKLTFATFLPTLIEEGMASFRGGKMAKSILRPELAAKVCKLQKVAFLTYLSTAVMAGIGMFAAVKIKDKIASKNIIDYNKHFDFDKNGNLDSAEQKAKETYINGRKTEREKLFNQFDINKNGQLEKEELAAMQAYLQEE